MSNKKDFVNKFGEFWYYEPCDMYVHVDTDRVHSRDKCNCLFLFSYDLNSIKQIPFSTYVGTTQTPHTLEEYRSLYCKYNEEMKRYEYKY